MDSNFSLLNYDISTASMSELIAIIRALHYRMTVLESTVQQVTAQLRPNPPDARPTNLMTTYHAIESAPPQPSRQGPESSGCDVAYRAYNTHGPQYNQGFYAIQASSYPAVPAQRGYHNAHTAGSPADMYNYHQKDATHMPHYGGHQIPPNFGVGVPPGQQSQGSEQGAAAGGSNHH